MIKQLRVLLTAFFILVPMQGWAQDFEDEATLEYEMEPEKSFALRLNPVGLIFGVSDIGFDIVMSEHFTLGGQVSYFNLEEGYNDADVLSYGVRGQFFFDQAYTNSWYFAGHFDLLNADTSNTSTAEQQTVTGFSSGLLFGYMWAWDYFNTQLGGGIQSVELENVAANSTIDTEEISGVSPTIEFNFGVAF